jgi:hypothetical protein
MAGLDPGLRRDGHGEQGVHACDSSLRWPIAEVELKATRALKRRALVAALLLQSIGGFFAWAMWQRAELQMSTTTRNGLTSSLRVRCAKA